jgi:hypothetical protein
MVEIIGKVVEVEPQVSFVVEGEKFFLKSKRRRGE